MQERATQLRRPRNLLMYWRDGQFYLHNFAERVTIPASPATCDFLSFFDRWQTVQAAVSHFASYRAHSVRSAVSQLISRRLLVRRDSAQATLDRRIASEWSAWLPHGGYHFSTKDALFIHSKWNSRQLKRTLPNTRQPAKFKTVKGARQVRLPPRTFPRSEFIEILLSRKTHRRFSTQAMPLESVSQLLSLVWGSMGYVHSPIFGKLLRKTSPSGGARHPGEVYLMALQVKGLRAGLYHYHPTRHHLELIGTRVSRERARKYCAGQDYVRDAAALFLMTAVFNRTMWKYHHPRAYRVVLLDAGHLCQTFCLVATWLGLAPFCTAALKDTLIEGDLGIDGVRESVLYVAGVGLPRTGRSLWRK